MAPFEVIPAVDLLGDDAVRLERGAYDRVVARAGDPVELVRRFAAAGARTIHVVDLDGARSGVLRPDLVAALVRAASPASVQASGGIRSAADAEALLAAGAARVVVGTAAFASPEALPRLVDALGDKLVVALDVRDGRVAVAGWERDGGADAVTAARRCAEAGVARVLCTAIDRDGTLSGPDLELLARVHEAARLPVLAAGGVASEADVEAVRRAGCAGVVVGRALLEGGVPLAALR
ncbi:MAG TPA: 1-(5-phosphoribosyl)-5-[(5-phosphoribosylamino)methylideneamino] imidazole-4-carboxamide isomerase [Gaiellaceae bacterium]|nr:1-(5-phosphoribosyl)-5-[(5-phosphoribosylamino)methylideneamino] imidazole-4-carboxamide isomerase [Gaiellaceae bacterium]